MRKEKEPLPKTLEEKAAKELNVLRWDGCDNIAETVKEGIYCKGCKHEILCRGLVNGD